METNFVVPEKKDDYVWISGLKHKVGRHGLVFVYLNNEWVKSNKTKADLESNRLSRFRDYTSKA